MKEFWERHKADLGLMVLVLYTLSLGVATADEIFHLGVFPTKLERLISEAIDRFDNPRARVRDQARAQVVQYGDFAVPQLVQALDRGGRTRKEAIKALQKITELGFESPEKWREWYGLHQEQFYPR